MPDEPVGSVAEETARLLAALGLGTPRDPGPAPEGHPPPDHHDEGHAHDGHAHEGHRAGEHVRAGDAVVCSLCPLCQAIGLARTVNPELLDRLADLAALAARTLRELATQAAPAAAHAPPEAGRPARTPRPTSVSITVEDDCLPSPEQTRSPT